MTTTVINTATASVKHGSTTVTQQITNLVINQSNTQNRIKTLGAGSAFNQTDSMSTVTFDFLFDDETGLYGALNTFISAGSSESWTFTVGDTKWTGTLYVSGDLALTAPADGEVTCSVTLIGDSLTVADAP